MDDFFSKDPAKALVEIKEKLYIRYIRTRDLVQMYDLAADTDDVHAKLAALPYYPYIKIKIVPVRVINSVNA